MCLLCHRSQFRLMQRIRLNRKDECEPERAFLTASRASAREGSKVDDTRHQPAIRLRTSFSASEKSHRGRHRRLGAINYRGDNGRERFSVNFPYHNARDRVCPNVGISRKSGLLRKRNRQRGRDRELKFATLAILPVWKLHLESDKKYRCFSTDNRVLP